ncbi:homocysteine S-methyltransferase family protein [Sphingomicrobium clamense]|uniref:Homocysteine S-methyltransferase family protein n=1 Tax=Sphingomicrobium clamense TaxID=2851013 RepID=A0ABS6V4G6_9SPHN|nr:homocysteine S-methyltransferase family protein [Sphingomicrobium sp. B8]MBW0144450.1 homocysteine S-methyltransferase family protein [Sphingomicrobium sp. B8]
MSRAEAFWNAAKERILVKDGAYGTMIQRLGLDEDGYRGELDLDRAQRGNNDLLNLTRPDAVCGICQAFVDAGADVLATNTFNANAISQADYGAEAYVADINRAAARLTREVAGPDRFVVGAVGPTNKTLSLSPDVENPAYREVTFDEVVACYEQQVEALAEGGIDFVLVETIFDTLNAKAAIVATKNIERRIGRDLPLMISMTLTDLSGRNLSGHTVEAFSTAIAHARPLTIGLNCSFGAAALRAHLKTIAASAPTLVMAYPNAGLPNDLGEYDEAATDTAAQVSEWLDEGLVNIVGGCCGTTPEHIAAIAAACEGATPRAPASPDPAMNLAGLEPMRLAS